MKYSFQNDYSESIHPSLLEALSSLGITQYEGYGLDIHSDKAIELIRKEIGKDDASIYFISGGTQTNLIMLQAILRPYQSVISVDTAHIHLYEAGAIEATGHKIELAKNCNGKITVPEIERILIENNCEDKPEPKSIFISHATELGSVYSKDELTRISSYAHEHGLYVYLDGARLGVALTSEGNDLGLKDIASLVDAFYIGGTKNGALFGEALIVTNKDIDIKIRYHMKQRGALLAKGWAISLQFVELFKDGLFYKLAIHANELARKLTKGIKEMGYNFLSDSTTNQIFPILPVSVIEKLEEMYKFYRWESVDEQNSAIRLVTSWATQEEIVDEFLSDLKNINGNN